MPEGLAPPPDEVAPPQVIGRPSEVEPLLERAGQRAQEVERAAARDIEQFMSQQMAEAEATEGFASAAEAAAGAAEAAAAGEAGGGALAAIGSGLAAAGEAALPVAATVGAAAGGLAVAGAGAALVGTAWALHGGMVAAEHLMGWGGRGGTDTDASRPSSAPDIQTLNTSGSGIRRPHGNALGHSTSAWTPRTNRSRHKASNGEPSLRRGYRHVPRGPRASRRGSRSPGAVLGQRLLPASDAASSLREVPRRAAPVLRGASQRERAGGRVKSFGRSKPWSR